MAKTKQEEIREGLAKRRYYDGMIGIGSGIPQWEDRTEAEREHFRAKIDDDFNYLHSQGVVIKVDRELPKLKSLTGDASLKEKLAFLQGVEALREEVIKAGYEAVEPLIEEGG